MAKDIKVLNTDVLVVGGGPAGVAAAIASARGGAKTLLAERYGYLGGMATAGLVNPFMVSKSSSGELIMSPIFKELIEELGSRGAAKRGELFDQPHITFDPEVLKPILLEMISEAQVKTYLHSLASGVIMRENRVSGAVFEGKSGQFRVFSKVTIDATGDADIAWMAGAEFGLGRQKDGLMQPATLNFRVGGVVEAEMPSRDEMNAIFMKAKVEGRINIEREKLLWFETTRPGELHFNTTRVIGIDGTSIVDLTRSEFEGRRQVEELLSFLKADMPGFSSSYIISTGSQIGVRETRRVLGHYTLTEDDVLGGKCFDDDIARCSYAIDIHDPLGKGTIFKKLNTPYGIPYRCLVPIKVEYLLVAGRPISVTHEAFSSTRVMPTCFAVGEAAGIAAALSLKAKCSPKMVNAKDIRAKLKEFGQDIV